MVLTHAIQVMRGQTYRLRYRALNGVGWGPYSDLGTALAAQAPTRPAAPTLTAPPSGTALTLGFLESQDDGGSRITSYTLWWSVNYYSASPTFSQVTGYTNSALSYTVSASPDGLVAGQTYAFRLRATNSLSSGAGTSEPSEELIVAAAQPIAQPAAPTRTLSRSTRTALFIEWAESAATEIAVQGYLLYMAEGTAGDFKLVYNGTFNAL